MLLFTNCIFTWWIYTGLFVFAGYFETGLIKKVTQISLPYGVVHMFISYFQQYTKVLMYVYRHHKMEVFTLITYVMFYHR